MRPAWIAALCCALLSPALFPAAIPQSEYRQRRAKLRADLNGTLVLFGAAEPPDNAGRFEQEHNFLYLTGWQEPGARLILTHDRELLFVPHHNERLERFTGKRVSSEDAGAKESTGFDTVLPLEKFETELLAALATGPQVFAPTASPEMDRLKPLLSLREPRDAAPLVAKLRVVKSPAEIAALEHAAEVSMEAQRAAWKRMTPGAYEYQAQAAFTEVMLDRGCEDYAYPPIVGSGPEATVLHYDANRRRMDKGELVVIDAAASCDGYASDITRTIPVGGKFSRRERQIYEVVLGAQKAAIAAVKPGASFYEGPASVTQIAKDYINTHGKDAHGEPLGKYFTHGLGHSVGLDVHDPGPLVPKLEEGMVVTIEPGVYIPEESIGVRIEDVVLVTKDGSKVLTGALPKEPNEVEKALTR